MSFFRWFVFSWLGASQGVGEGVGCVWKILCIIDFVSEMKSRARLLNSKKKQMSKGEMRCGPRRSHCAAYWWEWGRTWYQVIAEFAFLFSHVETYMWRGQVSKTTLIEIREWDGALLMVWVLYCLHILRCLGHFIVWLVIHYLTRVELFGTIATLSIGNVLTHKTRYWCYEKLHF